MMIINIDKIIFCEVSQIKHQRKITSIVINTISKTFIDIPTTKMLYRYTEQPYYCILTIFRKRRKSTAPHFTKEIGNTKILSRIISSYFACRIQSNRITPIAETLKIPRKSQLWRIILFAV